MATQIPTQVDSTEPEMTDMDGDLNMTEVIDDVSAIDESAYRTSILQNVKHGDVQHAGDCIINLTQLPPGSIEGRMYRNRVALFVPNPQRDLVSLVSPKEEAAGFLTSNLEHLKWIRRPEQDLFEATNIFLERDNPSFLRDGLVIANLSKNQKYPGIKYTMQSIPTDPYGDYDCILQRIDSKDRRNSLSVLKWLVFSERPLALNEMAAAASETRRKKQSKPDVKAMEDLVQVWRPFLGVHQGKVFFVHEKAKEYMKERGLAAQWLVELAGRRAKRRRLK
ncbi:unnamed protein product [Fusarium equiseti]|uniref:Uncharacterized protein n=1 Tax=Fusarium equiseti TaxID=61235 RepID=A0A8J2IPF1_FUSEQ|nr:unnamed protein product [Fusarium equiseti]